jgi:L-asparaginase II
VSTVLVEVMREGAVESVHAGVVVVVNAGGEIVAAAGDPETFAYFRSSAKPFQAIPLVESGAADRFGFTPAELALCCASHYAEPRHQEQVAVMLAKLGLDQTALQCGAPLPMDPGEMGRVLAGVKERTPLQCDCSGKHTGMLATSLHLGYSIDNYLDPDHPLQRQIKDIIAEVCRVPAGDIRMATNGCSLPTFGAPLRAFATAFAALAGPERVPDGAGREHADALCRLRAAMTAHPENVAGERDLVTNLMSLSNGAVVAKTGAEGLLCLAIPSQGLGIAIRIADGSFRAHPAIAVSVLEQLNLVGSSVIAAMLDHHSPEIRNHNNRVVGEMRPAFQLEAPVSVWSS